MIGKSVSHYQIVEKLGAGGMGVVWKARDTRLNRTVALKMLPPDYHGDPERRQRFLHEAQAASALSHPNIVTVYDIVEQDGADFIVMEYVPGKPLDALIPRKGLRLGEALRIAVQAADALSAAHRAGIVHRDLKPGNIMVTETGAVKVLDFGLAKTAAPPASDDDATRTAGPKTADGIVVGTIGYMSPEQAEAKPVDARSDIFSFGAMLYEMLTGERAFRGDTNLSTMAAILHKEPHALAPDIPAELHRVVARCLRKDPRRRFQHMDDLMVALEELREESDSGTLAATPAAIAAAPAHSSRMWIPLAAATVLIAAGAAWWFTRTAPAKPAIAAATEVPLTGNAGVERTPAFSPDGNQIAYSWEGDKHDNFDIYVKLIGSPTPLRLTTDPASDCCPQFSPDGHAIAFIRLGKPHNQLIAVPPIGGPERVIAELPSTAAAGAGVPLPSFSWLPDGKALVVDGLSVVSLDSGEKRPLTMPPPKLVDRAPSISPDGRTIAFYRGTSAVGDAYVMSLSEGGKAAGNPQRLAIGSNQLIQNIAWTADGSALVVGTGTVGTPADLWRIGVSHPGPPELAPFGHNGAVNVAIARTGNRLAYSTRSSRINLWRAPLSAPGTLAGAPERFLASNRVDFSPQYSPDGKRVVFHSARTGKPGLWMANADGSQPAELYTPAEAHAGSPAWSPDSQTVAFDCNETGRWQIYTMRAGGGTPHRVTSSSSNDSMPSWSHDGKWIYFSSDSSGHGEVWKIAASGGETVRVTRSGGSTPRESPDGKFLYFVKGPALWRMPADGGEESMVAPSVYERSFAIGAEGVYLIPAAGEDGKYAVQYLPLNGGKAKTVFSLTGSPFLVLALSPDGRFLLFPQGEVLTSALMLVENFH